MNFSTKAMFKLSKVMSNVDMDLNIFVDNPAKGIGELTGLIYKAESDIIEFVSIVNGDTIDKLEAMDGLDFVLLLDDILYKVEWEKLGKLKLKTRVEELISKIVQTLTNEEIQSQ